MSGGTTAAVVSGVLCAVLITLVAVLAAAVNRLARLREQADSSWEQVESLLARRYDLVAAVDDPAAVAARDHAMAVAQDASPAGRAAAESALTQALRRFQTAHLELAMIEDRITYGRQVFNLAVQTYNDAVRSLPLRLIAAVTGFRAREYFETTA